MASDAVNSNGNHGDFPIEEFRQILEIEEEFFSHLTALFFLGQTRSPFASPLHHPSHRSEQVLTVVSPRRRRNRSIGPYALSFIFHPPARLRPTQEILIHGVSLKVSTLEKTLIDLLSDMEYALPLDDLLQLFCDIPFDPRVLLNLAEDSTDTVLKRVSFILAWAGKVSASQIPFPKFSRTPVKLDPRIVQDDFAWDKRFFLKFPSWILKRPISRDKGISPWAELRSNPFFLNFLFQKRYLLIREDLPSKNVPSMELSGYWPSVAGTPHDKAGQEGKGDRQFLNRAFEEFFAGLTCESLHDLLKTFFAAPVSHKKGHEFPELFKQWIIHDPDVVKNREQEIRSWVRRHFHSGNPDHLESALFFGFHLGLHEQVINSLSERAYKLFNLGRFNQISSISQQYFQSRKNLPSALYILAARTEARVGRPAQAVELIENAKIQFEKLDRAEKDLAELSYALGNIYRQLGRYYEALSELFLARERFQEIGDSRGVGLVDMAFGNVFSRHGRVREARTSYLHALHTLKTLGHRDSCASILGNLGLIEYDTGNFRKALAYLTRSIGLHEMLQNQWNVSVLGMARGKTFLAMGQLTKAIKAFKECFEMKKNLKHPAGMAESAALLGWVCDLSGRRGASKGWWDCVSPDGQLDNDPRVQYLVQCLRAMTELFHGNFSAALGCYQKVHGMVLQRQSSQFALGDALHGIGACQTFLNLPEAPETLRKAREAMVANPHRILYQQLLLFSVIHFPESFPDVDVSLVAEKYMECQAFDPFWGLYAKKAQEQKSANLNRLLEYHLRKTPPEMVQELQKADPGLSNILKRIEIDRQRAAEFLTLISNGMPKPMHVDDYESWRTSSKMQWLLFDAQAGMLSFNANVIFLRPGSLSHGILTQLFCAFPHPVDLEILYKSVWATVFDPESDLGAIKSATQRLQKLLRTVHPGLRINRKPNSSVYGGLEIRPNCQWEVVLP